ncbi:MAG: universal stress protein [Myxococcales bacterium]|jgi:nucleotide-binding universal stress UspA family protein
MTNEPYVVVVGMDFSELADRALREAFQLTSRRKNSELHVVSIVSLPVLMPGADSSFLPDAPDPFDGLLEHLGSHVQALLDQFGAPLAGAGQDHAPVVSHVRLDSPGIGLAQAASDLKADLIVVGTHGRSGLRRVLMGSVAETTVRHARCPVLVVPPHAEPVEVKIEPPCAECVIARSEPGSRELWCAQHRERHGRRHTYHQGARGGEETNFPLVFQ